MDDYEKLELGYYLKGYPDKDDVIYHINALFLREFRKFRKLPYDKQQKILSGLIAISTEVKP